MIYVNEQGGHVDLIYVVTVDQKIVFTSSDANKAIHKSLELIENLCEHELKVYEAHRVLGTIELVY